MVIGAEAKAEVGTEVGTGLGGARIWWRKGNLIESRNVLLLLLMPLSLLFLEIVQLLELILLGRQTVVDCRLVLGPLCKLLDQRKDMQLLAVAAAASFTVFVNVPIPSLVVTESGGVDVGNSSRLGEQGEV